MTGKSRTASRRAVLKLTGATLASVAGAGVASADHEHPSVTTVGSAPAGNHSVRLYGDLNDIGEGADYADVWFQWGFSSGDLGYATSRLAMYSPGEFSDTVDGLRQGETIYFRAVAEDEDDGTRDYGSVRSGSTFVGK